MASAGEKKTVEDPPLVVLAVSGMDLRSLEVEGFRQEPVTEIFSSFQRGMELPSSLRVQFRHLFSAFGTTHKDQLF